MAAVSRFGRVWWVALVALVVNDHLLKGAGLLPGWLTGKLSDFAGLIVAPVLFAGVARARSMRARAVAFALVVAVFSAIKLSANAARTTEAAVGCLGIRWHLWCDPTDLVALAVIPLAWWVSLPRTARAPLHVHQRSRPMLAVILGAVACLATSKAPRVGFRTSAYLVNATLEPREIRIFRARGPLDCGSIAALQSSALASVFDPEICTRVSVGRVLPIDKNPSTLQDLIRDAAPPPANPPCDAVIVRVVDLPDTLLVWQALDDVDVEDRESEPAGVSSPLAPHAIYLEQAGDRLFAASSPLILASAPTGAPDLPDLACSAHLIDEDAAP